MKIRGSKRLTRAARATAKSARPSDASATRQPSDADGLAGRADTAEESAEMRRQPAKKYRETFKWQAVGC